MLEYIKFWLLYRKSHFYVMLKIWNIPQLVSDEFFLLKIGTFLTRTLEVGGSTSSSSTFHISGNQDSCTSFRGDPGNNFWRQCTFIRVEVSLLLGFFLSIFDIYSNFIRFYYCTRLTCLRCSWLKMAIKMSRTLCDSIKLSKRQIGLVWNDPVLSRFFVDVSIVLSKNFFSFIL